MTGGGGIEDPCGLVWRSSIRAVMSPNVRSRRRCGLGVAADRRDQNCSDVSVIPMSTPPKRPTDRPRYDRQTFAEQIQPDCYDGKARSSPTARCAWSIAL